MRISFARGALAALACAALAGPVLAAGGASGSPSAATFRVGSIVVEQPWSRATPGGARVAAGYMRIMNVGAQPDRLVGGSFAASGRFEVHETSVGADNVMRMRPLDGGVEIKPGESVELKPGGLHAMFLDLQRPLKEGEAVAGTLRFEKAGAVDVAYVVRGVAARSAGDAHRHH